MWLIIYLGNNRRRKLKIWVFRVSAMMTNCISLSPIRKAKQLRVIDPGGDPEELRES